MKKAIIVSLMVSILLCSSISMSTASIIEKVQNDNDSIASFVKVTDEEDKNITAVATSGPRKLSITKLKVVNGSLIDFTQLKASIRTTLIFRVLTFFIAPLMRPIVLSVSAEKKIDFTMEYKRDVEDGSKDSYTSYIDTIVDGNSTNPIYLNNTKHTLEVKGFYGMVLITHRTIGNSAKILLAGNCDKAEIITTNQ